MVLYRGTYLLDEICQKDRVDYNERLIAANLGRKTFGYRCHSDRSIVVYSPDSPAEWARFADYEQLIEWLFVYDIGMVGGLKCPQAGAKFEIHLPVTTDRFDTLREQVDRDIQRAADFNPSFCSH